MEPRSSFAQCALMFLGAVFAQILSTHATVHLRPHAVSAVSPRHRLELRGGYGSRFRVGAEGYPNDEQLYCRRNDTAPSSSVTLHTDIVVPDTHENISAAMMDVTEKHKLLARCGDHRWDGLLTTTEERNVTLDLRGESGTRLLGRWLLPACPEYESSSKGTFKGVTCAYATDDYLMAEFPEDDEDANMPHALFIVMGGPWKIGACELRAASADVFVVVHVADLTIVKSQIGGMGTVRQLNGSMSACTGVHCGGESRCEILDSTIEMCGNWGGSAFRGVDATTSNLRRCGVERNSVGVTINDCAEVTVESCVFKDNDFTQLFASDNSSVSTLRLVDNYFHEGAEKDQGKKWLSPVRPGTLEERGTQEIAGFSEKDKWDWEDNPDIPEDQWETHPDLIRLDRLADIFDQLDEKHAQEHPEELSIF